MHYSHHMPAASDKSIVDALDHSLKVVPKSGTNPIFGEKL